MAMIRSRNSRVQARVKHRLLPRPLYLTFDTFEAAEAQCALIEGSLRAGVVPASIQHLLASKERHRDVVTIAEAITDYKSSATLAAHDIDTLGAIEAQIGATRVATITRAWCLAYAGELKVIARLTPGSVRKRIGSLRRLFEWLIRERPAAATFNPFADLPRGYAGVTDLERELIERDGGEVREDVERDRRLEPKEEAAIRRVLSGQSRGDRERAPTLDDGRELELLLTLALETAMRMREMYTLTSDQVDLDARTIFLDRTKNGDSRQVPLSSVAVDALKAYAAERKLPLRGSRRKTLKSGGERLFNILFDGDVDREGLERTTSRISKRFKWLFDYARVADLRFHDLRHEATCRLYERTTLSDVQIARITGHRDPRMLRRYASLRGSDLAEKLW